MRVSFADDGENGEELTSAATGAVAAAVVRPPLTATARNVPSSHDGSATFLFELSFSEEFPLSYETLRDHAFTVSGGGGDLRAPAEPAQQYRVGDPRHAGFKTAP